MHRILTSHPQFGNSQIFKLLQLHSGIPKKAQSEVFAPLLAGEHKIILSTNIAETSVTIDDVAVVIDTGRLKEKSYDPHVKLAYLKSTWISQASARQRKGTHYPISYARPSIFIPPLSSSPSPLSLFLITITTSTITHHHPCYHHPHHHSRHHHHTTTFIITITTLSLITTLILFPINTIAIIIFRSRWSYPSRRMLSFILQTSAHLVT